MNRSEFESNIITKAFADPAYHERLLTDPKAVISEELNRLKEGAALPADMKVSVLQETPEQLYLVLPVNPTSVGDVGVSSTATAVVPQPLGATNVVVVGIDVVSQYVFTNIQSVEVVVID